MATRIHHYPWQDPGANQLKDQVGTLDGTWAGGTPLAPLKEGGIDRYIMYGSDNGYINFGNSDETTNFGSAAFMFEFRMRQHTRWNSENPAMLWRRLNASSHGVDIFSYANILYWRIRDPGGNVEVQYNIPADKLYKHYLLTKNGTEMRTLVNGASIGTTSGPATIADNTGQWITALSGQSVGYAILHTFDIDYISIWSGAFNTTEAAAYYATLDDINVVFADDKNAFPVTNLDFQIASLAGGNIVQAGTIITLGGVLVYDGSEFQSGYSAGSTITGDGGGGLLISVVPDTPWFENFPFVLEIQSINAAGTTIDRVYLTATETLLAVKNSGFEAGSGGSAFHWYHEGISPVGDIGTDSGIIDALPWWVAPEGTKVDILTSRLLSSLLGHVSPNEVNLGTGDATYAGTLTKLGWGSYIIPGTITILADAIQIGADDTLGQITGAGISSGWFDYFSGDYSLIVSGQSGKSIALSYSERYPSYHRAHRSDSLINPRIYSYLSFFRKIEVPTSPALEPKVAISAEVELDSKVIWSRILQSGDEGYEEEGLAVVVDDFSLLSSDPRIRDIVRMDTGIGDALAFDEGKKFVEEFTAWSDYYQVAPSEYDPALTFDDGAVDTEGFAQWAVPTQIVPTSLVLNDSLAWSTAYDAPASLAYPTPTQKARGTVDAVIVGENQPATVHTQGTIAGDKIYIYYGRNSPYLTPYDWGNGYAVWGNILFAAYATGSSVGMSICEFLPGGGGALFEGFGGVSLGSNWSAFVGDDIDNVYCTQFLSYGNSAGWELWILASLGTNGGVIREVGHYVWTEADPFVICNLGTDLANIPSRVVLTAIPALATEVSPILITPATGPGGSASVGTFWSE